MRARPVISGQPPKLVVSLLSRAGAISALFLFAASIYTCLIIAGHITEKAKIQENALLAGLVEEGWRDSARLQSFLRHLDENGGKKGGQSSSRSQLRDFVFDSFSQMGVEVFRHHFQSVASSFSRPNSSFGSGENVYAIVRAFRAAPVEAILLTVPMRSTHHQSIAVALAFADYARKQLYWARDIVFLFVDGGSRLALESWLSDYHGQEHNFFLPSELAGHGGSFIGAFGLDLSGSLFDNIQLQYGMVNGKLPNMDLLNLFVLLVEKAGSVPSIYGVTRARNEYDFVGAAQTFLRGVVAQSLDELEPLTAPFGRFGLHAVTLRGRPSSAPGGSHSTAVDLVDVVRLVEGGIRSLNNLLEKFHHSYLLYALTHPHRFLSSALYMPLLGWLVAPLLLLGLRHWFSMGGASQLAAVGPALCSLGLGHLLCLAFYAVQTVLYADGRLSSRAHVVPFSLGFPLLVLVAVPLIQPKMSGPSLHFARVAVCLELALFLGALGLVHFSLALLLSALLLPLALASLTIPAHSSRLVRLFCFLLLNPISLCLPLLPLQFCAGKSPILCYQKLAVRMDAIALAHFAHGSWLLALISGPVLAILLGITQILAAEEWKEEAEKKKKLE